MKINLLAIFIATALFIPSFAYPQASKVLIEKQKAWINPQTFDKDVMPGSGEESSVYYLLIDEQENAILQERYLHYAYKILTNEGIQEMSDISVEYDPSYQKLIFNQVIVHRNGKIIQQLRSPVRTIQREQSMDRFLYDGSLTAIINLTDIRVGDIIEYAYTKRGYNPVFGGHLSKKIYFNYNVPYEKLFQRFLIPKSYPTDLKYQNTDVKPEIKITDLGKEFSWSLDKMKALIIDDNAPDWHDPNQFVMITDFEKWEQVAFWATKHFATDSADRLLLKARLSSQFKEANIEQYALEAIRFVQDEIRYLGFETGLNSHKPHSPVKVFDQRFGDCKDKSLLLCEMLRARGIEANPVLVNTLLGNQIENESPAIQAFNHCVVQIKLKDTAYYVDPTINNQGGSLESNYFPTYGKGLVIHERTTDFTDFPPPVSSDISEVQTFEMAALGGEAILNVRTTYRGSDADIIRSEYLSNSLETIQKNYLTYYGNLYPDVEMIDTITTHDNRANNIFSVEEQYRIPSFWKQNEQDEEQMYCEVYPQTMEHYFSVSKSSQRSAPYRLSYPVSYYHHIHIRVPEEWSIESAEKMIESDFYQFERNISYADREVSLYTHYETKQNYVPVEAFEKFVSDHQQMMDNLSYNLTYNKNLIAIPSGISWLGIITSIASLGFGIWFALRMYFYYDPRPVLPSVGKPIGGWLILISLGLMITPFRLTYDLFQMPEVYDSKTWSNLLGLKRYGLFVFIFFEQVYNMVILPFSVLILVLFFKKRSSVPRLITFYLAITSFVTIVDAVVSMQIDETLSSNLDSYSDIIRSIVAAVIWIPYFNISSRVKETFVRNVDDDNDSSLIPEIVSSEYEPSPVNRQTH
ncbi:MAG: DUF3857 domain-containing protein [Cyclobacteriaceae bacterium]